MAQSTTAGEHMYPSSAPFAEDSAAPSTGAVFIVRSPHRRSAPVVSGRATECTIEPRTSIQRARRARSLRPAAIETTESAARAKCPETNTTEGVCLRLPASRPPASPPRRNVRGLT
eukprot:4254989-Pyramimonas_sp.AAC.1